MTLSPIINSSIRRGKSASKEHISGPWLLNPDISKLGNRCPQEIDVRGKWYSAKKVFFKGLPRQWDSCSHSEEKALRRQHGHHMYIQTWDSGARLPKAPSGWQCLPLEIENRLQMLPLGLFLSEWWFSCVQSKSTQRSLSSVRALT